MMVFVHIYLEECRHIHLDSENRFSIAVQVRAVYLPQQGNRRERLVVGKRMKLGRKVVMPLMCLHFKGRFEKIESLNLTGAMEAKRRTSFLPSLETLGILIH